MNATLSLKQLRTDPRELVTLINLGKKIAITDHRKVLAEIASASEAPRRGDAKQLLKYLKNRKPVKYVDPYPELSTVESIKKLKEEYHMEKYGRH